MCGAAKCPCGSKRVGLSTHHARQGHEFTVNPTKAELFYLSLWRMGNVMSKLINYADNAGLAVLIVLLTTLPAATIGFIAHSL
jgi:hypothetical protein